MRSMAQCSERFAQGSFAMKPAQISAQANPVREKGQEKKKEKEPEKAAAPVEGAGSPEDLKGKPRASAPSKLRILPAEEPEASAAPQKESPQEDPSKVQSGQTESTAQGPQPRNNRKRVRLREAMREVGLDEYVIAEGMAGLIEKLNGGAGEPKLLLEVLKESTRILEPPKAAGSGDGDAPVNVFLRHNVPRPARVPSGDGNSGAAGGGQR
jgi:hypothetical protein